MSIQWTLWNKGITLCRACKRRITSKPAPSCQESRHQEQYAKNVAAIAKNREEAWLEALVEYSGFAPPHCVLCGYSNIEALQLDHEKGNGARFRRKHPYLSGKSLATWLRKRNWPKGYRTLCANCQILERNRLGVNGGGKK